jgi:thiamine transporter ThiT
MLPAVVRSEALTTNMAMCLGAFTLQPMFNYPPMQAMTAFPHPSSTSRPVHAAPLAAVEQRLLTIGVVLATLALVGALLGNDIAQLLHWQLNAHGHSHLYAHGHPFVDARTLLGIPNALDVLSNLPFIGFGAWGLWSLVRAPLVRTATRQAATVFFVGLLLTSVSSSIYHWAPSVWGLAIDRAGMAVAFAGVLGLAAAERVSLRAAPWVWGNVLVAGMLAIALNLATGVVAPWAVVQFGGMAVVLWAAAQRTQPGALGVRWNVLIAIYAIAKLLELGDAAVFHASADLVSGHSLKHIAASLAALPVIRALRHNAQHGDAAPAKHAATTYNA